MKYFILVFSSLLLSYNLHAQCNAGTYDIPDGQEDILAMMNIPCAWDLFEELPSVKVGLMDPLETGYNITHVDLIGKVFDYAGSGCGQNNQGDHLLV